MLLALNNQSDFQVKQTKVNALDGHHRGIPKWAQQLAASVGIVLLSPVLLAVMALIRLESKGSCFYSQTRVGKLGRHFSMYKFRSMYLKTDARYQEPDPTTSSREGVCKKYHNDPRITKVGRFIRKYSIDELPQLFNIARGDMLIIGPRPALDIEVNAYEKSERPRLYGEAGLTGLWQISGRADTNFTQQVALDKEYIQQQSTWNDIKIVLTTIPCVINAKGAY